MLLQSQDRIRFLFKSDVLINWQDGIIDCLSNNLDFLAQGAINQYQKTANNYDKDEIKLQQYIKLLSKECRQYLGNLKDKRVLEVGCGTGRYFHLFKTANLLIGTDISMEMLLQAHERLKRTFIKKDNVFLVKADVRDLPFKQGLFDVIFSIGTIGYHLPFDVKVISEVKQLLSNDGIMILITQKANYSPIRMLKLLYHKMPGLIKITKQFRNIKPETFLGAFSTTNAVVKNIAQQTNLEVVALKDVLDDFWPQQLIVLKKIKLQI